MRAVNNSTERMRDVINTSSGVRMHCLTVDYSAIRYIDKEGSETAFDTAARNQRPAYGSPESWSLAVSVCSC